MFLELKTQDLRNALNLDLSTINLPYQILE